MNGVATNSYSINRYGRMEEQLAKCSGQVAKVIDQMIPSMHYL